MKRLLLAALAACAVPAIAADVIYVESPPSERTVYYEVTTPATTTYYYTPTYTPTVTEVYYAEPDIVVTAPRLTDDQAINSEVVDVLASDSRLSGRIGVETYDRRVELTGVVTTPGQARIASRDALSVPGVREVDNQLRTRVGGSRY